MKNNFIITTWFFIFCSIVQTVPVYAQTNAAQLKAQKAMMAQKMADEELIKALKVKESTEEQAVILEKKTTHI